MTSVKEIVSRLLRRRGADGAAIANRPSSQPPAARPAAPVRSIAAHKPKPPRADDYASNM